MTYFSGYNENVKTKTRDDGSVSTSNNYKAAKSVFFKSYTETIPDDVKKKLQEQEDERRQRERQNTDNKKRAAEALVEAQRKAEKPVQKGILENVGSFLKSAGESIAAPFKRTGEGVAEVINEVTGGAEKERQVEQQRQQQDIKAIKLLGEKIRSAKTDEEKDRYRNALKKITSISTEEDKKAGERQQQVIERTDPVKGAAAVGELGLNVVTGGTVGAVAKGAQVAGKTGLTLAKTGKAADIAQKVISPTTIKQAIGSGVAQGAVYGGLGTTREKGTEATAEDYAQGIGLGAATGGVVGGAVAALGPVARAVFDKASDEATKRLGRELSEAEITNLAEQTKNLVPEKLSSEVPTGSPAAQPLEDTLFTAAKTQAEQRLGRPLQPQELDNLTVKTKQVVEEKIGKQSTLADISNASEARPAAQLQKQIEDAYNAGDMKTVETLVPQLPDDLRGSTASALGVDLPKVAGKPFEPSKMQSRVYERLKAEQPESLKSDVKYDTINLKNQAEKAAKLISEDKQKAFRIAMGAEDSKDVTSASVNIAMAEQALEEGNTSLYSQLVTKRSLDQTRRGQEIVSERASVSDNSTSRYVKELINQRMEGLGNLSLKQRVHKGTAKEKAITRINDEVANAQKIINKRKVLDIKSAQAIIDGLACN